MVNESRPIQRPERRYCDGTATLDESGLYTVPICTTSTVQLPLFNTYIVPMRAYDVGNLSFCCKANYTAVLPAGTNLTAKDGEARFLYDKLIAGLIGRYDCTRFYPFQSCAPCLYAYRSWVCATMFPMACFRTDTGTYDSLRICDNVCLEVVRKCPSELGFDCPSVDGTYASPVALDPLVSAVDQSISDFGCNPMEYGQLESTSAPLPLSGLLTWMGTATLMLATLLL